MVTRRRTSVTAWLGQVAANGGVRVAAVATSAAGQAGGVAVREIARSGTGDIADTIGAGCVHGSPVGRGWDLLDAFDWSRTRQRTRWRARTAMSIAHMRMPGAVPGCGCSPPVIRPKRGLPEQTSRTWTRTRSCRTSPIGWVLSLPRVTSGGATPALLRVGLEPRWSRRPAGPSDTHEVLPAYAGWSEDVAGEEFFGCVLLAYAG